MFRLIATNTQSSLRPVLLRKVRGNSSGLKLGPNVNLEPNFEFQNQYAFQIARSNSTASATISEKSEKISNNLKSDHILVGVPVHESKAPVDEDVLARVEKFGDTLKKTNDKREKGRAQRYSQALSELQKCFANDDVKAKLSEQTLSNYASFLNRFIYYNRTSRLSSNLNRDSDQYKSKVLNNDIVLKSAIIDMADAILRHKIQIKDTNSLFPLFQAMLQTESYAELVELWEAGVNREEDSAAYLSQNVLSVVLPVAYRIQRFSYEEIEKIYDYNTKGMAVHYQLLTSMGKIAIQAGDNSRGLDIMEDLMKVYEGKRNNQSSVLHQLGELHLNFIGHCQDIKIAKHFFDKVVEFNLPYKVILKAPYVVSLLENCYEKKEPFSTITKFWRDTVEYCSRVDDKHDHRSRYATLHNKFFSLFFKLYPHLSEEGYSTLKNLIATYANLRPMDEIFINSIISNYNWGDRVVFQQLVENFEIHDIPRTPISYRVCLKKMGEIRDFTNEEILQQWYSSLRFLDLEGYTYIPIADWAALRDSTIMSPYSDDRTSFYLKVLDKFKNFHQDERACLRFARWWMPRKQVVNKVAQLSLDKDVQIDCKIDVEVPEFHHLRENVNYKKTTKPIFESMGLKKRTQ